MSVFSCAVAKSLLHENSGSFSLVHLNIRSLRKHYDDLQAFLSVINHSFSFICLSETWLSRSDENLYALAGYTSEHCSRDTYRAGGSAILIKSSVSYTRRQDISFTNLLCESIWLEFHHSVLSINNRNTIIASIYRSPSSSYSEFCSQLEKILNTLANENKNIIICGDININIFDPNSHSCCEYMQCLRSVGISSCIQSPTRSNLTGSGTLIDHILSNISAGFTAGVIDYTITDHNPVFLCLPSKSTRSRNNASKSSFNAEKFTQVIHAVDWKSVNEAKCAEKAFESFSAKLTACIQQCTTNIITVHWYRSPRSPWITAALIKSINKKSNLHKKLKSQPFNTALRLRLKKYSNVLSALVRHAKRDYYQNLILKNGNDTRRNWQVIKQFLNSGDHQTCLTKIKRNSEVFCDPTSIANAFSDHFAASECSQALNSLPYLRRCDHSFYLRPTCAEEVFQVITSLKNTGAGLDFIHSSRVKLISNDISPVLAIIINKMFAAGVFPNCLKIGKIIPVFKKGDRHSVDNYRPICILPFFSKVIEKIFYNRLMTYLTKFNLLCHQQFGFRQGRSTELALIHFIENIKQSINDSLVVGAVFIDLTKAFDTINHKILFHKLESFGLTGPPLQFIKGYLTNRFQVVQVNNNLSSAKPINRGVPQGSILGPLLFLLFINDLPLSLTHTRCLLYADDTTIYASHKNTTTLEHQLDTDLSNVYLWCSNNLLFINPTKTTFMLFHSPQMTINILPSLSINNHVIKISETAKFLGVILDKELKFH